MWFTLLFFFASTPVPQENDWHRTIGLLEYLEGDYAQALASGDVAELNEQRGFADEVVKQLLQIGEPGAEFVGPAQQIKSDILAAKSAEIVVPQCASMVAQIVKKTSLSRAPKHVPNLDDGRRIYNLNCATCHGEDGRAKTPVALALSPLPADFTDATRIETLTPYKAFNTISFGIIGTPMPGFPQLSETDRWSVAFYLFGFLDGACADAIEIPLNELASSTNAQLIKKHGPEKLVCFRKSPKIPQATIQIASDLILKAQVASQNGNHDLARQLTIDAYLNGLEPIEPALRTKNAALVSALEIAFTQTRLAAQETNAEAFAQQSKALLLLLSKAEAQRSPSDFWSVFFAALLIVLREGFEAVVVLGALLAAMKKLGARAQIRTVHAGWISALIAGALAFIFGQKLLAGANREWLEATVALLAVGMLLYAALWLNARSTISGAMGTLREKTSAAIGAGSTSSLFLIAFSSAGRESFETALFLQGLHSPEHFGAIYGALAGLLALLVFILIIRSVGFRLPMKTLFKWSTILLLATAIMLLGKGLHGLQELGVLPLSPVNFVSIAFLGIFPDLLSLVPQLILTLGCIVGARLLKHV